MATCAPAAVPRTPSQQRPRRLRRLPSATAPAPAGGAQHGTACGAAHGTQGATARLSTYALQPPPTTTAHRTSAAAASASARLSSSTLSLKWQHDSFLSVLYCWTAKRADCPPGPGLHAAPPPHRLGRLRPPRHTRQLRLRTSSVASRPGRSTSARGQGRSRQRHAVDAPSGPQSTPRRRPVNAAHVNAQSAPRPCPALTANAWSTPGQRQVKTRSLDEHSTRS
jgi:hypothetical protein